MWSLVRWLNQAFLSWATILSSYPLSLISMFFWLGSIELCKVWLGRGITKFHEAWLGQGSIELQLRSVQALTLVYSSLIFSLNELFLANLNLLSMNSTFYMYFSIYFSNISQHYIFLGYERKKRMIHLNNMTYITFSTK